MRLYYRAYERRAILVYRYIPQPHLQQPEKEDADEEEDGIPMFLLLVIFLVFLYAMKDTIPATSPVEQAKADMIQRCVKEKTPPDYCFEIAKEWTDKNRK